MKNLSLKLEHVLKLAGLWEGASKLPNGPDTILYKSFDEPTAAICPEVFANFTGILTVVVLIYSIDVQL